MTRLSGGLNAILWICEIEVQNKANLSISDQQKSLCVLHITLFTCKQ